MKNRHSSSFNQHQENRAADLTGKIFVREAVYRGAHKAFPQLLTPKESADFIRKVLPDNSREHFVALYLDGIHQLLAFSVISIGPANACQVHPRKIFQMALVTGAVAIIVGHNNPSGDLEPGFEDRVMTDSLQDAGKVYRIEVLDHLIVTDEDFFPLRSPRESSEPRPPKRRPASPRFVIFSAGTLHKHPQEATAMRYLTNGVHVEHIFRTDLGDRRRQTEWNVGSGQGDRSGDDDVDVLIRDNGQIIVEYR